MTDTAATLIAYCRENDRVCPLPLKWNALWELLPERRRKGGGWEPSLPLILGAWHYASNLEKMLRLAEHIEWADQHGSIVAVSAFLRALDEPAGPDHGPRNALDGDCGIRWAGPTADWQATEAVRCPWAKHDCAG